MVAETKQRTATEVADAAALRAAHAHLAVSVLQLWTNSFSCGGNHTAAHVTSSPRATVTAPGASTTTTSSTPSTTCARWRPRPPGALG